MPDTDKPDTTDPDPRAELLEQAREAMNAGLILEAEPPRMQLLAAVLRAQKAIKAVAKDSTAEVKKGGQLLYTYAFASTEDMMHAARQALLDEGVMPQRTHYDVRYSPVSKNGVVEVVSFFRLVHPGSGEIEEYPPVAMPIVSHNGPDKALAGALTYGWSYWLRDVLAIPRKDEHEPDRRESEPMSGGYTGQRQQRGNGNGNGQRRQQGNGGGRRDEPPREGTRTVTKPAGQQQGGQRQQPPEQQRQQGPRSDRELEPGTPQGDARQHMIEAAKALMAEAKKHGVNVDVYEIAGNTALEGKRWNVNDLHTVRQFERATAGLRKAYQRIANVDEDGNPKQDVPEVCAACGRMNGDHEEGCPEAPPEREPGADEDEPPPSDDDVPTVPTEATEQDGGAA